MKAPEARSTKVGNKSVPRLYPVLWVLVAAIVMLALPGSLFAQMRVGGGGPAAPIDSDTKAAIIDSVAAALSRVYVFPEVAERMEKEMRHNLRSGAYKDIATYQEFTGRLTEDLYGISKDRHLNLLYSPEPDFRLMEEDSLSDQE